MRSRETVEAELELNRSKCIHYATKEWDAAWFRCAGKVNELQDELAAIRAAERIDMMDPDTLTALRGSIAKWEANATASTYREVQMGSDTCPLCDFFLRRYCAGCPVRDRTGMSFCKGSPYTAAEHAYDAGGLSNYHRAAEAEVAFLKSLLPEETAHDV